MKRLVVYSLLMIMNFCALAQNISIAFTACDDNGAYVQLSRVLVANHTQGWSKTVVWPDTVLSVRQVAGNAETEHATPLRLLQNNPNPFGVTTDVCLILEEAGAVMLTVVDMSGRIIVSTPNALSLQAGCHRFRISMANAGTYLLIARQNGKISSVKMMCNMGGKTNKIEYQDVTPLQNEVSLTEFRHGEFINFGDNMEFKGYAVVAGTEKEAMLSVQSQGMSQLYTLQFVSEQNPSVITPAAVADSRAAKSGKTHKTNETESNNFRVALSLSPFSLNQFEKGYSFVVGDKTAATPEELQEIYRELGSTEMYVRIATKRHKTAEDVTDGQPDENANVHTFDQGIRLCQIAAELDIPINPEIMCAYTYMDMDKQQAPRFDEYPEFNYLMNGKEWSELTLDEICTVLEAYGEFIAEAILNTGCTVENWNLGNEANFGFAGISMGLKTAVDPKLEKAGTLKKYTAPVFARWWLKKHVWKHDAKAYAAVKAGILKAYANLGIDATNVKFSTHVATVVFPAGCTAQFFNFMKENGYEMETAGISYYPSAPSMSANKKKLLKKTVTKIKDKCGLQVFIGEFSYPSGPMEGPFAGWNKKVRGYEKNQQGQASIYADVISWGKTHGMAGIRYWAPNYEGWYAMSMFEFANKKGTAKVILKNHKEIIEK